MSNTTYMTLQYQKEQHFISTVYLRNQLYCDFDRKYVRVDVCVCYVKLDDKLADVDSLKALSKASSFMV